MTEPSFNSKKKSVMKKMTYTGFALLVSCVMLTAWTKHDKGHPASANKTQISKSTSLQSNEDNVIYITAEGYDNQDYWVGKTIPVTWINIDNEIHTVTDDNGEFDSGIITPGGSFTTSFPHAGVWTYHDQYSKATGMIEVTGRDE
jgi:plastocyanin